MKIHLGGHRKEWMGKIRVANLPVWDKDELKEDTIARTKKTSGTVEHAFPSPPGP